LRQKKRIALFHLLLIGSSSDCRHWKWKPVLVQLPFVRNIAPKEADCIVPFAVDWFLK
jgi:hypothetical protein